MKRALPFLAMMLVYVSVGFSEQTPSEAAFIETARAATAKYQNRAVAIAEGYRQIGSDFPGMGEHWIRIGLLFDGKFEPEHPEVLTYVTLAGEPHLLGVAYILPLLAGESAPDEPVGKEKWHDHFRTLEDETALPQHHSTGSGGEAPRMTMLHAWIWLANPAGMFAADNWAIPYFRLGLKAGNDVSEPAAKALSLGSGGAPYFSASVRAAASLMPREEKKIDAAFTHASASVQAVLRDSKPPGPKLSAIWTNLWKEIDASVSSKTRASLQLVPVR